jgi:hypothetical protein
MLQFLDSASLIVFSSHINHVLIIVSPSAASSSQENKTFAKLLLVQHASENKIKV